LIVTLNDVADGNSATIDVNAEQEMMFDTISIVQKLRDDLSAKLTAILANWETTTKEEIEQAVSDWLTSLDSGSLDSWLSWMGLPQLVIDAIKAVLATAGDLWGTLATFGVDVTAFVSGMVLSLFDYITGIKDLVSGPTMITYHLHLSATIEYVGTYPEGWKLSIVGETSKFPGLTILNSDIDGGEVILYSKNDVYPQGLLGLLWECDAIPSKSVYL
jgi:hypothetical protein